MKHADNKLVVNENIEQGHNSTEYMADDSFNMCNSKITPYGGIAAEGGLTLPMSLPSLCSLPE